MERIGPSATRGEDPVKQEPVRSGAIMHSRAPLTILGGDPGAATGLVLVHFPNRQQDGRPLWLGAKIHGALTVNKPEREGATHAEIDILFRRKIMAAIATLPFAGAADIVALEEPLDGGAKYAAAMAPGQESYNKTRVEATGTQFRLGAAYGALLAATAHVRANRWISFPVKTTHGRRGWMQGSRKNTLLASESLMRNQMSHAGYRELLGRHKKMPDHILMALGVVNHLVEYYTDYFPRTR